METADLLILEEIGELKPNIQAKLLTFIEDGKYYKVGATTESDAKEGLQIIATTNKKKEDMRPDFYDRFIKFTVPPLYKRRVDIFYYMLQFAPHILPKLSTWEIMSLLAYHWPGNVREIEAVLMDMELAFLDILAQEEIKIWSKIFSLFSPATKTVSVEEFSPLGVHPLVYLKEEHTEIKWKNSRERYQSMRRANVDVRLLQKLMNRFGLGFDDAGYETTFWEERKDFSGFVWSSDKEVVLPPFWGTFPWAKKDFSSALSSLEDDKERDAKSGTQTYKDDIFSDISNGLRFYCELFWRDAEGNVDLLSVKSEKGRKQPITAPYPYVKDLTDQHQHDELVKSIMEYCFGRQIDQSMRRQSLIDMNRYEFEEWAKKVFNMPIQEPEEDGPSSDAKESKENYFDMKEDELLKSYYKYLLQKTGGNKTEAAKLAGKNYKTFFSALKKLGINLIYKN